MSIIMARGARVKFINRVAAGQGSQGKPGKVREKKIVQGIKEKSGNFLIGQENSKLLPKLSQVDKKDVKGWLERKIKKNSNILSIEAN